jgi:Zn-dependent protease
MRIRASVRFVGLVESANIREMAIKADRRVLLPHPLEQLLVVGAERPVANHLYSGSGTLPGWKNRFGNAGSDSFRSVPAPSAFPLERIVRVVFGVVVVPFFAGLSLMLAVARSATSSAPPKNAPPDVLLIGVILLFALIAAYGLDQLLAGIRPSRRRWFRRAEERLEDTLDRRRGRGNVTVGRVWGAPISVHWSLFIGLVLVGGFQPGAWGGFLAVVVAHELGHAVLVRRFGHRVVALSFHALGGECQWIGQPTPLRRALIAWGGVAGQAVLLGVAWSAVRLLPSVFTGWFGEPLARSLVQSNMVMAAFNLLPISPLDGVEAWRLLLPRARARRFVPPTPRARKGVGQDAVNEVVESALERARRKSH